MLVTPVLYNAFPCVVTLSKRLGAASASSVSRPDSILNNERECVGAVLDDWSEPRANAEPGKGKRQGCAFPSGSHESAKHVVTHAVVVETARCVCNKSDLSIALRGRTCIEILKWLF